MTKPVYMTDLVRDCSVLSYCWFIIKFILIYNQCPIINVEVSGKIRRDNSNRDRPRVRGCDCNCPYWITTALGKADV